MKRGKGDDCEWFGKEFWIMKRSCTARTDMEKGPFGRIDKIPEIFRSHGRMVQDTDLGLSQKSLRGLLNMARFRLRINDPGIAFNDVDLRRGVETGRDFLDRFPKNTP